MFLFSLPITCGNNYPSRSRRLRYLNFGHGDKVSPVQCLVFDGPKPHFYEVELILAGHKILGMGSSMR